MNFTLPPTASAALCWISLYCNDRNSTSHSLIPGYPFQLQILYTASVSCSSAGSSSTFIHLQFEEKWELKNINDISIWSRIHILELLHLQESGRRAEWFKANLDGIRASRLKKGWGSCWLKILGTGIDTGDVAICILADVEKTWSG